MKRRNKRFKSNYLDSEKTELNTELDDLHIEPNSHVLVYNDPSLSSKSFDYSRFYGKGIDEITVRFFGLMQTLLVNKTISQQTVATYTVATTRFFNWLLEYQPLQNGDLTLQDITDNLVALYIDHLKRLPLAYTTQAFHYKKIKSILMRLEQQGYLVIEFPKNPFPNLTRQYKGKSSLSDGERLQLIGALKTDLVEIFEKDVSDWSFEMSQGLSICLLAICLRTGRNTTPMLELDRDAIRDHPLKEDRMILVTLKRRGAYKIHFTSIMALDEIKTLSTVRSDVVSIYERLISITTPLLSEANEDTASRLFLYRKKMTKQVTHLSAATISTTLKAFVSRHSLKNDMGEPLVLSLSILRKTFENRLWRLSGGDPLAVARIAGHSVKVSDQYYLEVTPEMEQNFKFLGEVLVENLRGNKKGTNSVLIANFQEKTPIASCKDPVSGHLSPKNGTPCIDFISCFRCKSFVVTKDDLERLYSFYWLLVKERSLISTNKWSRLYGRIVRIIDEQIAPMFDSQFIIRIRDHCKVSPHKYWQDRAMLGDYD